MTKKIIPLVSLIIIAILVITTLVMACVPKSYAPTDVAPTSIVIGETSRVYEKSDANSKKQYNKIYDAFLSSFTESSINALFNGRISQGPEVFYSDSVTKLTTLGTKYVMFNYTKSQTVTVEKVKYKYDKMVIVLQNTDIMTTVKVYLFNDDTYSSGTNYYISTIGNMDALVDAVKNLG